MTPLDRDALRSAIDRGERFSFRPFYGHTPRADGRLADAVFSQWWAGHPFVAGSERFATAEHFMMAGKARVFRDEVARERILAAETPHDAKALGRSVRGFDEDVWAAVRFEVVTDASVLKFSSAPELRERLLATKDAILVEAAPRDTIWGVGVGAEKAVDPTKWRGLNLLGFALVRARAIRQSLKLRSFRLCLILRGELPPVAPTPWR